MADIRLPFEQFRGKPSRNLQLQRLRGERAAARLMRRIDELHMNFPFASSRMLRDLPSLKGVAGGRRHLRFNS